MARFDLYRMKQGGRLVLDCQADLLDRLATRFVAPLVPAAEAPPPASRLNPVLDVNGADHVLMIQFATAVERHELGPVVGSLAGDGDRILAAIDMLVSGI